MNSCCCEDPRPPPELRGVSSLGFATNRGLRPPTPAPAGAELERRAAHRHVRARHLRVEPRPLHAVTHAVAYLTRRSISPADPLLAATALLYFTGSRGKLARAFLTHRSISSPPRPTIFMRCLCAGLAEPERGVTSLQAEYTTPREISRSSCVSWQHLSLAREQHPARVLL
jgi:hypothetical protein